jgi:hypothetical protein
MSEIAVYLYGTADNPVCCPAALDFRYWQTIKITLYHGQGFDLFPLIIADHKFIKPLINML